MELYKNRSSGLGVDLDVTGSGDSGMGANIGNWRAT